LEHEPLDPPVPELALAELLVPELLVLPLVELELVLPELLELLELAPASGRSSPPAVAPSSSEAHAARPTKASNFATNK
jgi:hypothetical protein